MPNKEGFELFDQTKPGVRPAGEVKEVLAHSSENENILVFSPRKDPAGSVWGLGAFAGASGC